jgi:hypothetical protein
VGRRVWANRQLSFFFLQTFGQTLQQGVDCFRQQRVVQTVWQTLRQSVDCLGQQLVNFSSFQQQVNLLCQQMTSMLQLLPKQLWQKVTEMLHLLQAFSSF